MLTVVIHLRVRLPVVAVGLVMVAMRITVLHQEMPMHRDPAPHPTLPVALATVRPLVLELSLELALFLKVALLFRVVIQSPLVTLLLLEAVPLLKVASLQRLVVQSPWAALPSRQAVLP
jgi:hypothetical protein